MIKPVFETLESRVLLSGAPAQTLNAVNLSWHGQTVHAVPNEYVVQTRKNLPFAKVAEKLKLPVSAIEDLGGGGFYKFTSTAKAKKIAGWASTYKKYITALSPNQLMQAANTVPNDPLYPTDQWQLNNTTQVREDLNAGISAAAGTGGSDIDAERAWDISTGDNETDPKKQIIVAVIDTGIDLTHPDLIDNIFSNPGEVAGDGIDNDGNGYVDDIHGWNMINNSGDPTDDQGHGTHVSGIIGAVGNNAIGTTGVMWKVKILPVKVLGTNGGTDAQVIGGIQYVSRLKEQGFNIVVVNASLGGSDFPFNELESRAVEQLGERGVLFAAAAGNGGDDGIGDNNDRFTDFPAKYSLNLSNVITVAATDNQDRLAGFSNFGTGSVQIAAPGVAITSTYPLSLDTTDGTADGYFIESGTSQATPTISGIIALEKSVRPNATAAELKAALINSAEFMPNLGSINSLPPKVGNGGRANALRALKYIQNTFVQQDTIRQGNWQGAYGASGAYIVGQGTPFPAFVTGQILGESTQVDPVASPKKKQALQTIVDPNLRTGSYQATTTQMTIDLNFTDALAHRVGVYMVDIDNKRRVQNVTLVDADSGVVIESRTISKFNKGTYLFWDVTGHVQIQITPVKGKNAVFSGIFFDTPPTENALLISSDNTTRGAWTTKAGSQGAFIVGESAAFPAFVSPTITAPVIVKRASTTDASGLQLQNNLSRRIIAYWSSATSFDLDLAFTDGQTHRTSLYFNDFQKKGRQTRVEILDAAGTIVRSRIDISNFARGRYLTYDLSGSVKIRVTNLAGPDAVLNGIFFDATSAQPVQFVGIDTTTRGNWRSTRYGTLGQIIAGETTFDAFNASQTFATVSAVGTLFADVVGDHTNNKSGLQKSADSTDRILSHFTSPQASFTIDINLLDNRTHRLALYASDNRNKRKERVEVIDAGTNAVLSTTQLASFSKGEYIVLQVRGHVQIRVTTLTTETPVLDGLFFD